MIQRVIFIASLLLIVYCETPYTQICEKERHKGELPLVCVGYCKIADQGCHTGLWDWKDQKGCTEEQEAQYIESRRNMLQMCQDYLEICTYEEDSDPPIEEASCVMFCQRIEQETSNGSTNSFANDPLYESTLDECREARHRQGELDENTEQEGGDKEYHNGDLKDVENVLSNPTTVSETLRSRSEYTLPKPTNIDIRKTEQQINRETKPIRDSSSGKYSSLSTCNIEIIYVLGIFCVILLILLWDNRRSYAKLYAQLVVQNDLLKKQYDLLLEKKKID